MFNHLNPFSVYVISAKISPLFTHINLYYFLLSLTKQKYGKGKYFLEAIKMYKE